MKAGTAKTVITPTGGVELTGYMGRVQPSVGIHDDLFARALLLEEAGEKLLWLHCDLLGFDSATADDIRDSAAGYLGIEKRQVALSATHTHSGPATLFLRNCGQVDAAYMKRLKSVVVDSAKAAASDLEEVLPAWAEGSADIGADRRKPSALSHVDRRLGVVALRRMDKTFKAALANFAVHNVALTQENRLVSADIFGVAAGLAEKELPGSPVVLLTNGACGNINPVRVSASFDAAAELGTVLGRELVKTALASKPSTCNMASREGGLVLELDVPGPDRIEADWRETTARFKDAADYFGARYYASMRDWRDKALAALKSGCAPRSVSTGVQAIRIGGVFFACMGAEVFSVMSDELREASDAPVYTVGYSNGDIGYLPPRSVYEEGGYEVSGAYKFYGLFMPAPGAFEAIRDKALELLRGLE